MGSQTSKTSDKNANVFSNDSDMIQNKPVRILTQQIDSKKSVNERKVFESTKLFISNLPTFSITQESKCPLLFSNDSILDFNDEMLIIHSKQYRIVLPFKNKKKVFEQNGFSCENMLNLIDKDILVILLPKNNTDTTSFRFFRWRDAITQPHANEYYTLQYQRKDNTFKLFPWITIKYVNSKATFLKVYSWKQFPHSEIEDDTLSPGYRLLIHHKIKNFSYDVHALFLKIQAEIQQHLAEPAPRPSFDEKKHIAIEKSVDLPSTYENNNIPSAPDEENNNIPSAPIELPPPAYENNNIMQIVPNKGAAVVTVLNGVPICSILNGRGPPTITASDGDFYLDIQNLRFYGPYDSSVGGWPSNGFSMNT